MKKLLLVILLFVYFGCFAQNKTITLKVPQSSGFTNVTVLPGQVLTYNGTTWVGVTQYSATPLLPGPYISTSPYQIPTLTGIVNVFEFNTGNNSTNFITLPTPSGTTNGRTIVLKPNYKTNGITFRLIGKVDGYQTAFTSTAPYIPNNGGTEFNITLVCDGNYWWITACR